MKKTALFIISVIVLLTTVLTSCKKDDDLHPCHSCGGGGNYDTTTVTPPVVNDWEPGTTVGTWKGYVYNGPQSHVYAFWEDSTGNLHYVVDGWGNRITSPTIYAVEVFNYDKSASGLALLESGAAATGLGQNIMDYFANHGPGAAPIPVTFERRVSGNAFGETQIGTPMKMHITSVTIPQ